MFCNVDLWNYRNGEGILVGYGQILPFSIHLYSLRTGDYNIGIFCKLTKRESILMKSKLKVLTIENF